MRILADMHISPVTVRFLQGLGHEAVRINEVMTLNASDREIVERAGSSERVILTQDLDFSEIIALSGKMKPSLISLRLSSSRIEFVNAILEKVLPRIEKDVEKGVIISVEDDKIRIRHLPF
jgi:predicted nuclease of predicted toxin-antitoxin system